MLTWSTSYKIETESAMELFVHKTSQRGFLNAFQLELPPKSVASPESITNYSTNYLLKMITDNQVPQISSHLQRPINFRTYQLSVAIDKKINMFNHIQINLIEDKESAIFKPEAKTNSKSRKSKAEHTSLFL
uniref:Uncharacterized protein n=1 Tax=Solanum lycopersicum TaxID=4081 RepID=A0A3Q7H1K3_SOLLC